MFNEKNSHTQDHYHTTRCTTQVQHTKKSNSEDNEKDEIWIELEDTSPQNKNLLINPMI